MANQPGASHAKLIFAAKPVSEATVPLLTMIRDLLCQIYRDERAFSS